MHGKKKMLTPSNQARQVSVSANTFVKHIRFSAIITHLVTRSSSSGSQEAHLLLDRSLDSSASLAFLLKKGYLFYRRSLETCNFAKVHTTDHEIRMYLFPISPVQMIRGMRKSYIE